MTNDNGADERQSFIAEARREQIIEATIATLDEIGYVNASLAQIAKRAGISTPLISYHFRDKNDLINQTLTTLLSETTAYVTERLKEGNTAREKLRIFIEARLAYQGTHSKHNVALIEIVFNARTPDNVPYYKLSDDGEDPVVYALEQLLTEGQASGEFREFDIHAMASAIQGAIGEYLADQYLIAIVSLETYCAEIFEIFDRATKADQR
ncbi:TetR family transcriptional regulator [Methanothrix sp.]|jgi:AcrR family transcriptional regulator|uniref:TetR family transcriptional regulator n=1 Tax=Methanothrix sp. TaxID=90426 RepID=UPI003BB58DFC